MQAHILVLDHDAPRLQRIADIEVLFEVERRGHQPAAQVLFAAVFGEGDAVHRADVDTGVAFDAQLAGKHGLHVAIETAFSLEESELLVIAELDLDPDVLQRDRRIPERHLVAQVVRDVVVVAPLVDAHLLADEGHAGRRPIVDILAVAQFVDRDRGIVAVRHGPDDVLRPEGCIAPKEDIGQGRLHRLGVDLWHAPAVEFDPDVALDPREGVLLADRDQDVVAWDVHVGLAGRDEIAATARIVFGLDLLEQHPGQLAPFTGEFLRHQPVEDRDAFVHRVLFFPCRGLHFLEAAAYDDRDLLAAETARRAAAIHRGVAAAEHDNAAADLVDMAKRDAGEPVDADMDIGRCFLAPGDIEVAAPRGAAADEHRVPAFAQ